MQFADLIIDQHIALAIEPAKMYNFQPRMHILGYFTFQKNFGGGGLRPQPPTSCYGVWSKCIRSTKRKYAVMTFPNIGYMQDKLFCMYARRCKCHFGRTPSPPSNSSFRSQEIERILLLFVQPFWKVCTKQGDDVA